MNQDAAAKSGISYLKLKTQRTRTIVLADVRGLVDGIDKGSTGGMSAGHVDMMVNLPEPIRSLIAGSKLSGAAKSGWLRKMAAASCSSSISLTFLMSDGCG